MGIAGSNLLTSSLELHFLGGGVLNGRPVTVGAKGVSVEANASGFHDIRYMR
jgi:hypothetical protein